uniref:AT-rich interactive domain-containing protein 3 n=1 Tax=Anas platyrhynchos platyrhynchos TaxID=8840 RepID=A0A493TR23_ANAPP
MSLWVCACEPVCLWTHTSTHVCTDPCETPCVCMYGAIWTHGCFGQGLGLTPSKTLAPARGAQGVPAPSPLLSGGARSLSSHRSPSPPTAAPWGSVLGLRGGGVKTNQGCEETGAACGRGATAAQAGVGAGDECAGASRVHIPGTVPCHLPAYVPAVLTPFLPQLYELDEDPKRKEFLDDLFSFMQKRGTPVNRIPIMAKQVLDLYTLYRLVTDKGGLVEVINKKIWREITKGLNLPTSITSAAFTLRTQYMKYLYPYECEKRALSSPGELQAAIDSNRREGRRQTFGAALFNYSPAGTPTLLGSPKMPLPALSISTHSCGQMGQAHGVKKEDGAVPAVPGRIAIPVGLAGHHLALREKLETGEPPEKKDGAPWLPPAGRFCFFWCSYWYFLPPDDRQETALNLSTNGISSINMSIEINGVPLPGQQVLPSI